MSVWPYFYHPNLYVCFILTRTETDLIKMFFDESMIKNTNRSGYVLYRFKYVCVLLILFIKIKNYDLQLSDAPIKVETASGGIGSFG